jgi:xyloglucan-specific exo-beta-1,4-glucanase
MRTDLRFSTAISAFGAACAATMLGCNLCPCPPGAVHAGSAPGASSDSGASGTVTGTVAYQWKSVTILGGGFVTGIIFNPAEKDLIYARTDIGGAYRYNPTGKSWIPITDMLSRAQDNYKGIESIAPDPIDPNRVYLAVGTYTQEWAGTGAMMLSRDRGNTWEITEFPIKMGGNENGRGNGERLAVDPNDNRIILFGSRKYGLWKSEDAGNSWEEGEFPQTEEPLGVGITFVLFDKASGTRGKRTPTIYAGWASTEGGLYRSTDGGENWKLVPGQPKGVMPSHAGLDSHGVLYLSYGDKPGPSEVRDGAIWKYDPKHNRWTDITPLAPKEGDKFGYGGLSVSASTPGTVMVSTIDRWGPGDEIFRTTDGGKSWKSIGPQALRDDGGAKYLYWGRDKPSATGWMADIDIDPSNPSRVMYVTGQGIWGSEDAAEADADRPTHWKFINRGLEETAVTDIASPPSGPPLLSTVGDICGFRHDDLDQPPPDGMFTNPIFGGGSSLDFAASRPEVVVRVGSHQQGQYGAYSEDGGKTWQPFATSPKGATGSGEVVVSADASTIIWAPKDGVPS